MKHNKRLRCLITTVLIISMLAVQTVGASAWSNWTSTDQFGFANSSSYFQTGKYTMTDDDYKKICRYIRGLYSSSAAVSLISKIDTQRNRTWGGSCYGMAMSTILQKSGQIDFINNFDPGKTNMSSVSAPYQNESVQSAINYYFMTQVIPITRDSTLYKKAETTTWKTGLKTLVTNAKAGKIQLFCYSTGTFGHAIVLTGKKVTTDSSGNFLVPAYDNRYPNKTVYVKVGKAYGACTVNDSEACVSVEYASNFDSLDNVDIDGPNNDMMIIYSTGGSNTIGGTHIIVPLDLNSITIKSGDDVLNLENGTVTDDSTMEVEEEHLIIGSTADNDSVAQLDITVPNSGSFTFETTGSKIDAQILCDEYFSSIESELADKVTISPDSITIDGNNATYKAYKSVNEDGSGTYYLEGTTDSSENPTRISYSDGKINVSGDSNLVTEIKKYTNPDSEEITIDVKQVLKVLNNLKPTVSKISVGKRCIIVKASKAPYDVNGYGYQIAYKKTTSSKWKHVNTTSVNTKIKGLTKGAKYQVKIRPYYQYNSNTIYSLKWSNSKTSAKVK